MSLGDAEVVRGHIEAFRRQDVRAALSYIDPYVVCDPSRAGAVDWPVTFGHEPLAQLVRRYRGAFEEYDYRVQRLTRVAPGAVVAVVTETGRGRTSGVPVERSFAALYTVIDGKIARITMFASEAQALEAVGLRE